MARRLDVNLSAVQKRIRAGTLSTLPGGKLDWGAVQREWIAHRNASQVRKTPRTVESGPGGLLEARTRREYLELELERLRLAQQRGELAPFGEVNAHVAGMVIRSREILTQMPAQLKDRLAQSTDPRHCEELIGEEIERALTQLREFRPAAE